MGKCVKAVLKAMGLIFIAFCLYVLFLYVHEQVIPDVITESLFDRWAPTNLLVRCNRLAVGIHSGLTVDGLRIVERDRKQPAAPMISADRINVDWMKRRVTIVGARYPRLPDSYYAPYNLEKNARVEATFPRIEKFALVLEQPRILSTRPARVEASVEVFPRRIVFGDMRLDWPEKEIREGLVGSCTIDLDKQELVGEVGGLATQPHIRPMLVALDVPVSLPYMDGFTGVREPVKSWCGWKVNLVNNDFDLWLDLHPLLGAYNKVPMTKADGKIHLHSYTRGTCLNYTTTVGPIDAIDPKGRELAGSVVITGTNNYNVVTVDARSALPMAEILKIGGFTGHYVNDEVMGKTTGRLEFRFPRAMTNNYEVLNGEGHVKISEGQLMQLRIFSGLTPLLAKHVPGISFMVDQTQATADYRIENGVIKSDNISIEGGFFTIMMTGTFDSTKDELDFTVKVLLLRNDSLMGKYLVRPVTWPFTKLLLEFRLTGSSTDPQWHYISILDRVMDIVK